MISPPSPVNDKADPRGINQPHGHLPTVNDIRRRLAQRWVAGAA
jgi:hypothetical protein